MKKYLNYSLLLLVVSFYSCAAEGYNLSPMSNSLSSTNDAVELRTNKFSVDRNINASEISQLVSTFPEFKNDAVDGQISQLKVHLTDYLQAVKANNIQGKDKSLDGVETCYKKIQKLRNYLDSDHNEILNRYLVRIKTNIAEIESISGSEKNISN